MPVALFWDKSLDGHCIDESKVLIVVSSMNVFTNFMLLVMPITQLWNLKVGQSKKIQLMAVFLLGGG